MAPTEQLAEAIRDVWSEHGARRKSKVLMGRSVCLQFMGDLLLSNDSDLDASRSDDRHLQRADGEARNYILWQLLSSRCSWCSKREDR